MKKVIGIYCGASEVPWDSDTIKTKGLGGSESWAVYLGNEFAKAGFQVIIFGNPEKYFFNEYNVEYVPFNFYENRLNYQHFDYFVTSRRLDNIIDSLSCDNIYLICHDTNICLLKSYEELLIKLGRIKKVILLSESQQNLFFNTYPILNHINTYLIPNGVDETLYTEQLPKKNQMVWSSCYDRGLEFFAKYVLPLIKAKVPDFKVISFCYDKNQKLEDEYDGLEIREGVSKQELAKLQCESKIFIYPPTFEETFCITAVENAFARNALILTDVGALADTLRGYKGIFGNNYITVDHKNGSATLDLESYLYTANLIAELAVELLTNEEKRLEYANQAYEICKDYTWKNSAKKWFDLWFKDLSDYIKG